MRLVGQGVWAEDLTFNKWTRNSAKGDAQMARRILPVVLAAIALVGVPTLAFAKDKKSGCEEGWLPAGKGVCYQQGDTKLLYGTTYLDLVVKSPRAYTMMMLSIAMYKGGKLACTGTAVVNGLEKGEDMPAKGACTGEVENPDKIVVKVGTTM